MSIQARKTTEDVAFAAAQAHNDTRKGSAGAWTVRRGSVTLVSGAATITDASFNADTRVSYYLITPGGTLGVMLKQSVSNTTVTLQSVSSTGTNVTTDTSTYAYVAETPCFHADQTSSTNSPDPVNPSATFLTVTASNAADLPTSIALANNIRQVLNQMMADSTSHLVADTTNPVTTAIAVDLTTTEALLNACKTAFNAHLTQSGVHVFNDDLNNVSTTNATDLPSSETLANALKTAINAHLASAPVGESVTMVQP